MTTTVAVTYSVGPADMTSYVLTDPGIQIRRGKGEAFGATEITTCSFSAKRAIMKTAAWRLVGRTTQTITVTVNGSVRFTGWWWRHEEDIFDERGILRVTLASSALRSIIEDTRSLRFSTRTVPSYANNVMYVPVDAGLIALGRLLDDRGQLANSGASVSEFADDPSGTPMIQDPPTGIPQLGAGARNTYTSDARLQLRPAAPLAPPFSGYWCMNASPATIAALSLGRFIIFWTENMSWRFGISSTGLFQALVRDETTNTALVNVSVPWATRDTQPGELWLFELEVSSSGANVVTTVRGYPLSRAEGNLADLAGNALVSDTSAAPAVGIGSLERVEWGPKNPGLYGPADLLLSDIVVQNSLTTVGSTMRNTLLSGRYETSLTADWIPYFGAASSLNAGTYTALSPTIPPGTGAEHLAIIEEVHRTVVRDSRTADLTTIRTNTDYLPVQVTELALGDTYLYGAGSAGEEGELSVIIPDGSYPLGVDAHGAAWQRARPRRWARLPVYLDDASKRAVDVGISFVSFFTRPGNLFRGRVVGIEENVSAAAHTAFWTIEEWPHKGQIQAGTAVAREAAGSALAATVSATYSGGGTVTVDATYSAYDVPFTVRPAAESKYYLVISGVAGTTWTVNTGASSVPPSMAVGDQLNFDSAAIAF